MVKSLVFTPLNVVRETLYNVYITLAVSIHDNHSYYMSTTARYLPAGSTYKYL